MADRGAACTPVAVRPGGAALHRRPGLWLALLIAATGCGSPPPPQSPQIVRTRELPPDFDPASPGAGVTIADAALHRLGAPYRYGGTTGQGFDCSGLVYRLYLEHGVKLPRTVRDQSRVGRPVTQPVSGDLLFFRLRGGGASHVGVYLGDGTFVHASSGRRRVVRDDLRTSEYFRDRYVGARRIVPLEQAD